MVGYQSFSNGLLRVRVLDPAMIPYDVEADAVRRLLDDAREGEPVWRGPRGCREFFERRSLACGQLFVGKLGLGCGRPETELMGALRLWHHPLVGRLALELSLLT